MKSQHFVSNGFLLGVLLLAWGSHTHISAQTPPTLAIQPYAGLTVTGAVDTVYSIEYVTELTPTNWNCLEFVQLPKSPYLWIDKSAPITGQRFYRATVFPAPTNMVFILPGTFMMGSPTNEADRSSREGPLTAVTISRGFWMGKFEVTQADYVALTGANPSFWRGPQRPVDNVSWSAATNFCARLTRREQAAGRIPQGSAFQLPTEAQWEYACRAWTSTRFSHGDDPAYSELGNYGWYSGNSLDAGTQPVGQLLPNPWGLHDMHGNLWEWCADWWSPTLPGGMAIDPRGPASGTDRVIRGGAYAYTPSASRSASRWYSQTAWPAAGFRVVLVGGQP